MPTEKTLAELAEQDVIVPYSWDRITALEGEIITTIAGIEFKFDVIVGFQGRNAIQIYRKDKDGNWFVKFTVYEEPIRRFALTVPASHRDARESAPGAGLLMKYVASIYGILIRANIAVNIPTPTGNYPNRGKGYYEERELKKKDKERRRKLYGHHGSKAGRGSALAPNSWRRSEGQDLPTHERRGRTVAAR